MDRAKKVMTESASTARIWALGAAAVLLLAATPAVATQAETAKEREYQLKAAFLYNFLMFVDGPRLRVADDNGQEDRAEPNEPIVIGIIGQDPFGEAFTPLEDKRVQNRPVMVKRFRGLEIRVDTDGSEQEVLPNLEAVRQCHLLFVCASERAHLRTILGLLRGESVLTVSDIPDFAKTGGAVGFIIEAKKVRFEINTAAATRAKLEIRSKLLRLATRVLKVDLMEEEDEAN